MLSKYIKFKDEKEFKRFMKKRNPKLENPPVRCKNFYKESPCIPDHCYNCIRRNGYPFYLGGDEGCLNYEVKK